MRRSRLARPCSPNQAVDPACYFYVKKAQVGKIPELQEFISEFTSEKTVGIEGYLAEKGLIPLSAADRQIVRTTGEKLELLNM